MRKIALFFSVIFCLSLTACSHQEYYLRVLPEGSLIGPTQLSICDDTRRPAVIDQEKPVFVIVHGCNSSGGIDFRALAQVFQFHGQQTLCFNYNDRDSLETSSAQLTEALNQLTRDFRIKHITIIGHSQGGLVARRAMIKGRRDRLALFDADYRLVTISSPFLGIKASADCGKTHLHVLTLGVTVGICRILAGSKWSELYPGSDFMTNPGELPQSVQHYIKVVTDERNSCLVYDKTGHCVVDDYVFSVEEQYNQIIDSDRRVSNIQVQAGHVEIVGDKDIAPRKLITILQQNAILNQTPVKKKEAFENLLSFLY